MIVVAGSQSCSDRSRLQPSESSTSSRTFRSRGSRFCHSGRRLTIPTRRNVRIPNPSYVKIMTATDAWAGVSVHRTSALQDLWPEWLGIQDPYFIRTNFCTGSSVLTHSCLRLGPTRGQTSWTETQRARRELIDPTSDYHDLTRRGSMSVVLTSVAIPRLYPSRGVCNPALS